MNTEKTIALNRQTFIDKVMSLLFNMMSRLFKASLPRSKHLLISWLQPPSAVILEPKKIESLTVSTVSPSIFYEMMIPDAMTFIFWMLTLNQVFHSPLSPSSRGFSVLLSLFAIRAVSSAYLRLLIFPSCDIIDISTLWFTHPSISHDVFCM